MKTLITEGWASMGPPELPGGNSGIELRLFSVAMLQWGRRNYPAETIEPVHQPARSCCASMGPPELPGGNLVMRNHAQQRQAKASMGPPELPGGNLVMRNHAQQRQAKASMGPPELPGGNTPSRPTGRSGQRNASMGPPELPGGNTVQLIPDRLEQPLLQWGRRNYPAETCGRWPARRCRWTGFNGAAGITRRKPACAAGAPREFAALQWGRRNYPAETCRYVYTLPRRTARFNGAAGIIRRKLKYEPRDMMDHLQASMGPPELPGGNA